ncbi:MAG: hypothetical protein Q4P06_00330 [Actinomycetaceae bacterium]|nr:hypothetical protein [Actinomycetaceae bacterium]
MWFRKTRTPQLPEEVASCLRRHEVTSDLQRAVAEETEDGKWLVATKAELLVANATEMRRVGHWCELQSATWEAKTRELTVSYLDPQVEPYRVTTRSEDPHKFMGAVKEGVHHAVVAYRQAECENGTVVAASVRRGPEGEIFSAVVAYGPLDEQGQEAAAALEAQVREDVGLAP